MTQLKLRPVNHAKGDTNRYCGPSAISAITGCTTGEAARLLRDVSGLASIKGASPVHVKSALARFGICVERIRVNVKDAPTLAAWLRATHGQRGGKVFLIVAWNHWQVISGNRYVCGISRVVVDLDSRYVKKRARVTEVYELTAPRGLTIPTEARKPKAKPDSAAGDRAKAKKLAAKIGVIIDRHTDLGPDYYYVYHPALEDSPLDPREDDHYAHCWEEVLERVKEYEACLALRREYETYLAR